MYILFGGKKLISKENFIKYIDKIKRMRDIEDAINEAGKSIEFFQFSFGDYEDLVFKVLEDAFDDQNSGWISYFIYELDFGKKWHEGSITQYGKSIPMRNAGELYDVLRSNIDERI